MKRRILNTIFIMTFLLCCSNGFASYKKAYNFDELKINLPENIKVIKTNSEITVVPAEYDSVFVFYPGALVDYDAYLPLMVECSKYNIKCIIVKMHRNLSFFGINKADGYQKNEPDSANKKWFVGGHSLGGAIAGYYVSKRPGKYDGLIFLASYTNKKINDDKLKCVSIYGSLDGVLNMEQYEGYKCNNPSDYTEFVIEGGNHAGFGTYGHQKGDNDPAISNEEQLKITAEKISEFCKICK